MQGGAKGPGKQFQLLAIAYICEEEKDEEKKAYKLYWDCFLFYLL